MPPCSRASGTTSSSSSASPRKSSSKLRAHQVPHRDCQLVLEQHLQGGGHHRQGGAAEACQPGEGQYHQLPHGHGEQRQGLVLHVLRLTERRGAARCRHQQD